MERRILLIGGPARCGKSTLAKMVRQKFDGQVVSGDALARGVRESIEFEWMPELFTERYKKIELSDPPEIQIERLRQRDKTIWKLIKNYILAVESGSTDNILIDGGFWPDYLPELCLNNRAVFLVDTSSDRAKWLISIRDNGEENNWMRERNYSDEKIASWAEFDIARSKRIIELCKENGYTYFDIADHGIDRAQELALSYLLA
jgi:2-phosphoglycerate kinase